MAGLAGRRELRSNMVWICCLIVLCRMAAETDIRGIVVISVMTGCTFICDRDMSTRKDVIVIVDRESGRGPSGVGRMTGLAFLRDIDGGMAGID